MPFSLPGDCKGREPSLDALISLRSGEGVGAIFPFAVDCCGFGFAGLGFFLSGIFPPHFFERGSADFTIRGGGDVGLGGLIGDGLRGFSGFSPI